MSDIGQGGRQGAVLGVEEGVLLAGQLSEWGYTVAAVDSSRAVAIVASTVDAAVAAQARGLPFLLEGGAPAAAVALEALGASGYAFLTPDDLRRGLMVLERRGWAPLGPAATVSDLLEEVCGLRRWLEGLRGAEVQAQQAHAQSTAATDRHIEGLERQRAALEEHRDVLLARVDELATAHAAVAARLAAIEATRAWRFAAGLKRQRDRLARWARPR